MAIRRIKKLSDVIEALRLYQLKPLDCKPHCPYAEECENPDDCICSSREEDALIYLEEFQGLRYCHPHQLNVEGEDILLCSECYYKIEPCVNFCQNCGRIIDWNWEGHRKFILDYFRESYEFKGYQYEPRLFI